MKIPSIFNDNQHYAVKRDQSDFIFTPVLIVVSQNLS
jgi:hypothetical protein